MGELQGFVHFLKALRPSRYLKIQLILVTASMVMGTVVERTPLKDLKDTALLYLAALLIYLYFLYLESERGEELAERRAVWMAEMMERTTSGSARERHFINKMTSTEERLDFRREEIGFKSSQVRTKALPPDVEEAEKNLIQAEERSSILIAVGIFIPLLFALSHIFRPVPLSVLIVEVNGLILIVSGVSNFYTGSMNFSGWEKGLRDVDRYREEIVSKGHRAMFLFQDYFRDPRSRELNYIPQPTQDSPARTAIASLVLLASELPPFQREEIIEKFLKETETLPEKESLMTVRWKALKGRVVLIGIIGMAIAGVFAGLANFSLPVILSGISGVQPTNGLHFALLALALFSTNTTSQYWLERREQIVWNVLWMLIFWAAYFSVKLFVFT